MRKRTLASLERSLKNLRTDRVDLFFMHEPQTIEEAKKILAPGGAMEAFVEAKKAGKVRFVAISGHGRPAGIQYSIENHPYDVLMTGFKYFDRFNFPQTEEELLPLCRKRGVGVLGMKALADGYLFRNVEPAIRYILSLPIASSTWKGLFDRQVSDYSVPDPQIYALQERFKHWFDQSDWARKEYGKLKIAHSKLAGDGYIF